MATILMIIVLAAIIFALIFWFTGNQEIAGPMFVVLFMFGVLYGTLFWWPSFECEQRLRMSGHECTWDFFAGCQVKVNGQWVPYDKWRVMD